MDGAFVTVSGEVRADNFNLVSGNLAGAGTLTVNGFLRWTGGSMTGTGVTNANGGLEISGPAGKELFARTLNNPETATWTGTGNIGMGGGAVFNNTRLFIPLRV